MRNTALFSGFLIALTYFGLRCLVLYSGIVERISLLNQFPIVLLLPVFIAVLWQKTKKAFYESGSRAFAFKEGARLGLFTALFSGLSVLVFYTYVDLNYLPGLIQQRLNEAKAQGILDNDLAKFEEILIQLNSVSLRSAFTVSGLMLFSFLHSFVFTMIHWTTRPNK